MKRTVKYIVFIMLILLIAVGCSQDLVEDGVSRATARRYRENEIVNYEGAKLDPIIGPRDNSINGIQYVDINDYKLKVSGLVDQEVALDYSQVLDLEANARKITLFCVEGWDATILWEGVLLEDIMNLAGISPQANTVIFKSYDGYTTSLPLDTILSKELILAYKANGLDLPADMGYPFIVVAEDKLGYKWARWVVEIELSDNDEYKGFWEQVGYDNEADV